ncbi:MAG: response regulator [Mariprofundaceae bacterium]|nr:response regulator [Mariprofundaceae bacterium]
MRVLAIDDDVRVRKVLVVMLEFWEPPHGCKHEAFFAHNGLEGIEWIEKNGVPELLLLDVRMPKMNGAEFLQKAHQRQWSLPRVLLLTGYADDLERHMGSEALGMPHLRKPFTIQELYQSLDQLMLR